MGCWKRPAVKPLWNPKTSNGWRRQPTSCVVAGYLLVPSAIQRVVHGDPVAGDAAFTQAAEIARRFGDRDLASLAYSGRARALIRLGYVGEGVALLDDAMGAVFAGEVTSSTRAVPPQN